MAQGSQPRHKIDRAMLENGRTILAVWAKDHQNQYIGASPGRAGEILAE
jgi:hypothetical protein